MENITRIAEKLSRLEKRDTGHDIFGADSHDYRRNPVLREEEAAAFETQYGVRLPEEYRLYLTKVANGGAGPFYGLFPLGKSEYTDSKPDPGKPFPFTADTPLSCEEIYNEIDDLDDDASEAVWARYWEMTQSGIVYLAHEGCGMFSFLVVSGAEYGNVWYEDLANDCGVFPLIDPQTGESLRFFRWFELWLDAALASLDGASDELDSYTSYIRNQ